MPCVHVVQRRRGPGGGAAAQAVCQQGGPRSTGFLVISGLGFVGGVLGAPRARVAGSGHRGAAPTEVLPSEEAERPQTVGAQPLTLAVRPRAGLWLQKPFPTPDFCPGADCSPLGHPSG